MLAVFSMDHRLAVVALAALSMAAAVPLAHAWARLLPEDPPPFEIAPVAASPPLEQVPSHWEARHKGDAFAVFLLVCMTLSYVLKFPGLPVSAALQKLAGLVPQDYLNWAVLGGRAFFVVVPGLASAYSSIRPNPIRIQLIIGGVLVIALWLLAPILSAAIAT